MMLRLLWPPGQRIQNKFGSNLGLKDESAHGWLCEDSWFSHCLHMEDSVIGDRSESRPRSTVPKSGLGCIG